MNLRAELLSDPSRDQAEKIADRIGTDAANFAALMTLFLNEPYRVTQRAAVPVAIIARRTPEMLAPHLSRMIARLAGPDVPVSVKRNVVRLLQFVEIPARYRGKVFDICYSFVDDPEEPVAVRAFSLTVAAKIAAGSPELISELRLVAFKYPQLMTAGLRVRVRRIFGSK